MSRIVRLVWDGGDSVHVPPEMGVAKEGQLQGTVGEQLIELAGRVCYDSLGRGRDSRAYHAHIREVGHGSVWEHFVRTVDVGSGWADVLVGRPGVWYRNGRITFNPRVVADWDKFGEGGRELRQTLQDVCFNEVPNVMGFEGGVGGLIKGWVRPRSEWEAWVSLYIRCSRGCSHELVRQGDFSAISQRSTRYVDESSSDWLWHPLLAGDDSLDRVCDNARAEYDRIVRELESRGHDRKACRGAARGVLGNALGTELIMSCNMWQWNNILKQRLSPAADGEIREIAEMIHDVLVRSRYGVWVESWTVDRGLKSG